MCPRETRSDCGGRDGGNGLGDLDKQRPPASVQQERAAPYAIDLAGRSLDGQRIGDPVCVADARAAAAHQPQPPRRIHVAGIASTVPHAIPCFDLRLVVARCVEITTQHVRAGDDDFAGLVNGQAQGVEFARCVWTERRAPAVGNDANGNRGYRQTGEQAGAFPR